MKIISLRSSSKDLILKLEQRLSELEKDKSDTKEVEDKVRRSISSAKSIEAVSRRMDDISL